MELGRERYGLALLLILASIVFIMAAGDGPWARVVATTLQALAVVASLRAAGIGRRYRYPLAALIGVALLFTYGQAIVTGEVNSKLVEAGTLTLILVATPAIAVGLVRQATRRGRATLHTMLGVLCIYLLISLGFAAGYGLIEAVTGEPFFNQGAEWDTLSNYLYYSLTTITTFGIGDFSPASDAGRAVTAAEALLGQIYVVTVVALIVSNLLLHRN